MLFNQIWDRTRQVPSEGSYYESEARALYDALSTLKAGSTILETGCGHGRSTSILGAVAKQASHRLILIDPYLDNYSPGMQMVEVLGQIDVQYTYYRMKAKDVPFDWLPKLDFFHIDGDHSDEGVKWDCAIAGAKMNHGGVVAVHDYGPSMPPVQRVIDEYLPPGERISVTDRLALFRIE